MLPPIPQGLVPVTVQQDPARQRPDVQPVTPATESEANSQISTDDRRGSDAHYQPRKRRQREETEEEQDVADEQAMPGKREGMSRKGLLVNIRV